MSCHVTSCVVALLINLGLAHAHQCSFIHNCVAKFFNNKIITLDPRSDKWTRMPFWKIVLLRLDGGLWRRIYQNLNAKTIILSAVLYCIEKLKTFRPWKAIESPLRGEKPTLGWVSTGTPSVLDEKKNKQKYYRACKYCFGDVYMVPPIFESDHSVFLWRPELSTQTL